MIQSLAKQQQHLRSTQELWSDVHKRKSEPQLEGLDAFFQQAHGFASREEMFYQRDVWRAYFDQQTSIRLSAEEHTEQVLGARPEAHLHVTPCNWTVAMLNQHLPLHDVVLLVPQRCAVPPDTLKHIHSSLLLQMQSLQGFQTPPPFTGPDSSTGTPRQISRISKADNTFCMT